MRLPAQTRADRQALAIISPADIAQMEAFVASMKANGVAPDGKQTRKIPGGIARQLWTAGTRGSRFSWNRQTLQFTQQGQAVNRQVVKAAADAVASESRFRMFDIASKLARGQLGVVEWGIERDRAIKLLHGAESALARGGFGEMTAADWTRASERIANQYGYSRAFSEDVAKGLYGKPGQQVFQEARLLQRVSQYANAGRVTYENTLTENSRDRLGHTHARRVRASGVDSCPDCIEIADNGWYPIDDYLEIGGDACRMNCSCISVTGFGD